MDYLLKNALLNTEEIPFNVPKKHHRKSKTCRIEHVEFEKFRIRRTFPQNTVKLRNGKVLFCDDFKSDGSGTGITLIGRLIDCEIREVFPGSLEVGCGLIVNAEGAISCLCESTVSVPASEVRAKCSLFPAIPSDFVMIEQLARNPEKTIHPESFSEWIVVDMVS